jgi:hypothetical protein
MLPHWSETEGSKNWLLTIIDHDICVNIENVLIARLLVSSALEQGGELGKCKAAIFP